MNPRVADLIRWLGLQPHPEGGHYRELFRSALQVTPGDGRGPRRGLTCIDFLLAAGEFSAWHRVTSDEAWHRIEGAPLRLWLMPPTLERIDEVVLDEVGPNRAPRHVVPAQWWQAAEPLADYSLCGATVGPGFEFADFAFGRDDAALRSAIDRLEPSLSRLL
jgi:predicted cupin superfamily sugar epimerase